MKKIAPILLMLVCLVCSKVIFAALSLELTQGISAATPIALVPFKNDSAVSAPGNTTLSTIINRDLANSGQFRVVTPGLLDAAPYKIKQIDFKHWRGRGVNDIVIGSIIPLKNNQYSVRFALLNVYAPGSRPILAERFTTSQVGLRTLAHHISDQIYQSLTGIPGIFSTKIAYVLVQHPSSAKRTYYLEVADADGFNPHALLRSSQPIMSPTWSPDGQYLAYVSFEEHQAAIYLQCLATGHRQLVSRFPGINGAPNFSPDGHKLAMVLSVTGNPKIYVFNRQTHKLKQITYGFSIDTEPDWSPDGKSILFTSNRGGAPQIYQYNFATRKTQRVTFDGNYNAHAEFLPNEQEIIMMHRETNTFGIAKQDMQTGRVHFLVSSGSDESPSIAPNGKMVIYAQQQGNQNVLAVVSTDGRIKLRLPSRGGSVQEPAWSPFKHL